MTTPSERVNALIRARELLLAFSKLEEPVDVSALRANALNLLRHYPDPGTIGLIADRTEWLEMKQGSTSLTRKVMLPVPPLSAPTESLNEAFFEDFRQRELENSRARVRTGELLPPEDFRRRLDLSEEGLRHLVADGRVFSLDVDGLRYFPSLLSDERHNRTRLFSICKIIWPAHPTVRLHYLTSKRGNLGGLTPLECLADNRRYRLLREMARAEVVDCSRTAIKAYEGLHNTEPGDVSPSYSVAQDFDPRCGIWEKALRTLSDHGFTGVPPPYEQLREATVFVAQVRGGTTAPEEGARLTISIDADYASVNVERFVCNRSQYLRVHLDGNATIEEVMHSVFRELSNRGAD